MWMNVARRKTWTERRNVYTHTLFRTFCLRARGILQDVGKVITALGLNKVKASVIQALAGSKPLQGCADHSLRG